MDSPRRRKQSFLLRLPCSVRDEATEMAQADGTSLNQFIALAVTEKISRLDQHSSMHIVQKAP